MHIHLDKSIKSLLNSLFCHTHLNGKECCFIFIYSFSLPNVLNTKLNKHNICSYNVLLFHDLLPDFFKILISCHNAMKNLFHAWESDLVLMQCFHSPRLKIYLRLHNQINSFSSSFLPHLAVDKEKRLGWWIFIWYQQQKMLTALYMSIPVHWIIYILEFLCTLKIMWGFTGLDIY